MGGSASTPRTWSPSTRSRDHARVSASEAEAGSRAQADAIALGPASEGTDPGPQARLVLAVARHLVEYATWRSLAVDQGLGEGEVVDVAVKMLLAVTPEGHAQVVVDAQDA